MDIRRKHAFLIPAVAALVAVAIPLGFTVAPRALADDAAPSSSPPPSATASIVKVERWRAPRKKVVHRKFRPWAHPTPTQVREIIRNEAHRWRISAASLARRVNCESRYRWWATNGQYAGVLQFSVNAFYRGMSTIRSRELKIVRTSSRRVHDARITHYSDGHKVTRRTTPRRQRVIVVLRARLPRHPPLNNAFAQIRIGAQAIRGISAVRSSEWACGA